MRKLQIGVMGSAADLKYAEEIAKIAEELGEKIAQKGGVLFFGAEKDDDSLSTAACRGAKKFDGQTVGVTYGKGKNIFEKNADIIICCGAERGGPRESVLVLSCDVVISVSGGSGTLTELAIAYQGGIPMVAMRNTGGWSDKMADKYFDGRGEEREDRHKVYGADTTDEAVEIAFQKGMEYLLESEKEK